MSTSEIDRLKHEAAARAVEFVTSGMRVGLGSGSTSEVFINLLGARVRGGLDIVGVPTSERTAQLARSLGIAERTVKVHLGNVFRRIGVSDRTSAALWARENMPELLE